ncbi:DUF4912 domain-containing protein [Nostoc sp. MG11]|uniref:DUF4912 domain-containing protein n=1 Tax=Nostoc sp. MG11 TaxID=2721166 RepID=UPI0018694616|nr:DUF4912 domain-containing protein [Nostoc sp. MG11]
MFHQQKSLPSVAILFAFTATSISTVCLIILPAFAQSSGVSTSFPVPQSVPSGTKVQINGTTSMEKINQALAERFKAKFPGTNVNIAYDGTDASLKALPNGKIDLAAIGRSLTQEEKARGLVSTPVTRNKIAVILGKDNPYKNSLTSEQFARIFRGEITNWSQVGGSPQTIRLIDRPENSDLRQSFQNYPVFKTAAFKTGANAVKSEDNTEAVINKLGTDGIGYAIADQVINNPNVQIVPLHNVPPTDPRYPFSQPLGYAHQRPITNPAAQAFLGYATALENQQIIEEARVANAITTPAAVSIPTTTTATRSRDEFPWWILLLFPLLGGLLWWLLSRRTLTTTSAPAPVAAPVPLPVRRTPESRIILTPRNCRDAYAYWEVPDEVRQDLQRLGGRNLKVRLYDVTDIDMDRQTPHSMKEFDCDQQAQDIHIPIAVDNRDYIAELGYTTNSDRWVEIARSSHVRIPACEPVGAIPLATAGVTTGVAANSLVSDGTGVPAFGARPRITKDESRLILVPRDSRDVYAYWEVPEARKAELQQQGGRKLALRVYDTTGIDQQRLPARNFRQFDCDELTPDLHIPIAQSDRDYVAELGYVTDDGRWLELTRSKVVKVPSTFSVDNAARHSSNTGTVFERNDNLSNS